MFCGWKFVLANSWRGCWQRGGGNLLVRKAARKCYLCTLSFIQTFSKCLLAAFSVRRCAQRFNSRETRKCLKLLTNLVHLGEGRCESRETAAKLMFQVILVHYDISRNRPAVYGVAQSRTRLKRLSSSSSRNRPEVLLT